MSHGHQRRYSPRGRGGLLVRGGMPGYSQYHQQLILQELQKEPPQKSPATQFFDQFCSANTFQEVMLHFQGLCDILELKPSDHKNFYHEIKSRLTSWKAQSLWAKLDKRAAHKEYRKGTACTNTRVLIIGGGPVGLRMAIEVVLLGGKAVVLEKRDRFSRNSVLHLWPFIIHDLKALGAKKFFGKFCAGSIDHISIRSLQCILLKICLLLGVEVHPGVAFEGLREPPEEQSSESIGWRANVSPSDHPVSEYEFDVLIGADGKRNTLEGFKRKEFRGKLAIAITANFINRHTNAEARVEEISGVAFIFNQKFFKDLNAKTGIDLENIVYYKDETHYFIMTAKKQSLLHKGVLIKDHADTAQLLGKGNVDQEALMAYACEAADVSTRHMMPKLEYAHNHYGTPDVAMFDFTSLFAAEHASQVREVNGHKLLVTLVGDSLLEPFWPTGSGCARGFLGALDSAWMIKSWASGKMTPLEVMAQRESVYQLLSQTTPENIQRNFNLYTIDPNTRYPNINMQFFKPPQVRHQYSGGDHKYLDEIVQLSEQKSKKYEWVRDSHYLLKWFQRQLEPYKNMVKVLDLTTSWRSGLALCCLIHKYRPELIDVASLDSNDVAKNNQLVFDIAEKEFGIGPVMSGQDMAMCEVPDKLTMVSYLSQFYEYFRKESIRPVKGTHSPDSLSVGDKVRSPRPRSPSSRLSILSRISNRIRQRRKEALEARDPVVTSSDEYEREEEKENDDSDADSHGQTTFSYGMTRKRLRANNEEPNVVLQRFNKVGKEQEEQAPRVRHKSKPSPGVRGANKVSALAKDLATKLKGEETPPQAKKMNPKSLIMGHAPSAEVCYFCMKRVYLVERHSAEGVFFHRHCLRCEFCGSTLRIGQYAFQRGENGEAQFYCLQHLGLIKPVRRPRKRSYDENDLPETVEPEPPPPSTPLKSPEKLIQELVSQRPKRTPERIEYYTESEMEESEWEQTQHNLSATLLDVEDESESESDSDIDYSDEDLRRSNNNGSTDEEVDWSDEELSDGETSWAELAKAYNRRLGRSSSRRKVQAKKGEDDTETETAIEESDDDWETESETEKESEGEDSDDEPARPRKVYQISDTVQTTKAAVPMFTQVSPPPPEEREPSKVVQASRANRLSFFSAAPEPVRIDAFSFLGIDKHPKKMVLQGIEGATVVDIYSDKTEEGMEDKEEEEEEEMEKGMDEVDKGKEAVDVEEEVTDEESSSEAESTEEETMTEGSETEEEEEGEVQIVEHQIPTIQVEEVQVGDSEESETEDQIKVKDLEDEVAGTLKMEEQQSDAESSESKEEAYPDSVKEILKVEEGEMDSGSSLLEDFSSSGALDITGDTKESEEVPSISEQHTLDEQESISTEVGVELSESVSVNERLSSEEEQPSLPMEFVDTSICQVNIANQYSDVTDLAQVGEKAGVSQDAPVTVPKDDSVILDQGRPVIDVAPKTEAMEVETTATELPGDIPEPGSAPLASMQDSFHELITDTCPLASMGEFDSEFMETTTAESALDTEPEDMPTPPVLEDRAPFSFDDVRQASPKHEAEALKRIDDLLEKLKHSPPPASSPTATLERDAEAALVDVSDLPIAKQEARLSECSVKTVDSEKPVSDIIEVTLSADELEAERSFVVDESFVTSRDRRKKKHRHPSAQSDSSFTISTPSGSIKSSASSISEMDSMAPALGIDTRESSLSFDQLVGTGAANDSLSLDNLVDANMNEDVELASPIKPAEIVRQLKEELICEKTLVWNVTPVPQDESLTSVSDTPADNSVRNGSTFLSADSSVAENTDDSKYFTPDVSGIEPMDTHSERKEARPTPLILDVKVLDNSLNVPDQSSPLISPSRIIVDAKRRFFFETAQPVRIDPKRVFDESGQTKTPDSDISSSSVSQSKTLPDSISQPLLNGNMEAEKNLRNQQKNVEGDAKAPWKSLDSGIPSENKKTKISGHLDLKRDWQSLDSGVPMSSSPTAGVPHADTVNGEADVFYTPATSLKTKPKADKTKVTRKSSEAKKRLLPDLPTQKSKVNLKNKKLTAEEIKLLREAEQRHARNAARERARMMSDEDLGIEEVPPKKEEPLLREKLSAPKLKTKLRSVSDASTRSAPADLKVRASSAEGKRPVSSVSAGAASPHMVRQEPEREITSPKSDPSPSLLRRDIHSISSEESKSESCKSDKTKDKKFKVKTAKSLDRKEKTKEGKESVEKKDKRRSFLSMLLPSKSIEKKEKEKENRSKSPKLHREKDIEELPENEPEMKSPKTEDMPKDKKKEKTPTDKKIPKLRAKLRAKSLDKEKEEKRGSAYDEFSPMFEDMFGPEAAPKKKEHIQERLQAVAPAKTPPRPRFPPKATMDEFDTESEFGDDKSVRSFHSQTTMTEEERARMLRKQEKAAARRQREMELKRLRKAQEIQRQLEEVEQRQRDVETRGIQIERSLRGEGEDASRKESEMMQEWFNVVHEKNLLVRYESELMVHARELELEDRHSRLEAQLRKIMTQPDLYSEEEAKEEEKRILEELLEVVEQRDALVALLEEDRLKEQEEDQNLNEMMGTRGFQLSPVTYMQEMRRNVTQTPPDSDHDHSTGR